MAKGQAPTRHSDKVSEQIIRVAVTSDSNTCIKE